MKSILEIKPVCKIRPNLWIARDGAVIGFGAILAPGGLYFCFTCSSTDCDHTASVNEAWVSGEEQTFASSADLWPDDYGLAEVTL